MSERILPEDMDDWPDDPHELLGVSRGVSVRDVKRAYARLLRQYKPEQYAEQFRRIREAYETLLRYAEWFSMAQSQSQEPCETAQPAGPSETSSDEVAPSSSPNAEIPPRKPRDDCWKWVCDGEETRAYRTLCEEQEREPQAEEVYLRLYWLLWTRPELDPEQKPADWLHRGLRAHGCQGPLLELLREEVAEDPEQAISESYTQLLDGTAPAHVLSNLLEQRWLAADRLKRWEIFRRDLDSCRERISRQNESVWFRILVELAARLAWLDPEVDGGLFDACVRECRQHHHLSLSMSDEFDRLDLLVDTRNQWQKLQLEDGLPSNLLHVLQSCSTRPFEEIRPTMEGILAQINRSPGEWLRHLDAVQTRAPAVLSYFGRLLDLLHYETQSSLEDPHDEAAVTRLAADFFNRLQEPKYRLYRQRLLRFCLHEVLSPEKLSGVTADYPSEWPTQHSSVSEALLLDWPLRYVFQAYHLFWA